MSPTRKRSMEVETNETTMVDQGTHGFFLQTPSQHPNNHREHHQYELAPPLLTSNKENQIVQPNATRCKHSERYYKTSTSSPLPYLDTSRMLEQVKGCGHPNQTNKEVLPQVQIRPRKCRKKLFCSESLHHQDLRSYFLPIDNDTSERESSHGMIDWPHMRSLARMIWSGDDESSKHSCSWMRHRLSRRSREWLAFHNIVLFFFLSLSLPKSYAYWVHENYTICLRYRPYIRVKWSPITKGLHTVSYQQGKVG